MKKSKPFKLRSQGLSFKEMASSPLNVGVLASDANEEQTTFDTSVNLKSETLDPTAPTVGNAMQTEDIGAKTAKWGVKKGLTTAATTGMEAAGMGTAASVVGVGAIAYGGYKAYKKGQEMSGGRVGYEKNPNWDPSKGGDKHGGRDSGAQFIPKGDKEHTDFWASGKEKAKKNQEAGKKKVADAKERRDSGEGVWDQSKVKGSKYAVDSGTKPEETKKQETKKQEKPKQEKPKVKTEKPKQKEAPKQKPVTKQKSKPKQKSGGGDGKKKKGFNFKTTRVFGKKGE